MADVAIVGGGPAGLAAALSLVRARKRVVLFDCWPPRNAAATEVRGYVTQDGTPPAEMRRVAQEQLEKYEAFDLRGDTRVTSIRRQGSRFIVEDSQGRSCEARRVMLCVGLVDQLPELPGYRELWGTSLFQCPYCHGWEVRDRAWGYLANDPYCLGWSMRLRAWTKDLVVFTGGRFAVDDDQRRALEKAGIRVEERRVIGLGTKATGKATDKATDKAALSAVMLEDGATIARDVLFVRPPQRQTELVQKLGIELAAPDRVKIDDKFQTSIAGIYAAGDLVAHDHGALTAAASGAAAGHALDDDFTIELVEAGLL